MMILSSEFKMALYQWRMKLKSTIESYQATVKKALKSAFKDLKHRPFLFGISLLICSFLAIWKGLTLASSLFVLFMFVVHSWDKRAIAAIAFACLLCCPILLWLDKSELADTFATYAYCLLLVVILLGLVQSFRKRV